MLVETSATVFDNTDVFDGHDWMIRQVAESMCLLTPEACLDEEAAFVADGDHSLVFDLTVFQLAVADLANSADDTYAVDCPGFIKSFDLSECYK